MTSSFNRIKETVVGDGLGLATQAELQAEVDKHTKRTGKVRYLSDYNPTSDGSADTKQSFNNAFTSLQRYDTLKLGAGTFKVDSMLRFSMLNPDITIEGEGMGKTIIDARNSKDFMFFIKASGITLKDFTLLKPLPVDGETGNFQPIYITEYDPNLSQTYTVEDIKIENVEIEGGSFCIQVGSNVNDTNTHGLLKNVTIDGCKLTTSTNTTLAGGCIHGRYGESCKFINNYCYGGSAASAINLYQIKNSIVSHNEVWENKWAGIESENNDGGNIITDNNVFNCPVGIMIDDTKRNIVSDNNIVTTREADIIGIRVSSRSDELIPSLYVSVVKIADNTIYGYKTGIMIEGYDTPLPTAKIESVFIRDNDIIGCKTGVQVGNGGSNEYFGYITNVKIIGNNIEYNNSVQQTKGIGVYVSQFADDVVVRDNEVRNHSEGINIDYRNTSNKIRVKNNDVSGSDQYDIRTYQSTGKVELTNNTIEKEFRFLESAFLNGTHFAKGNKSLSNKPTPNSQDVQFGELPKKGIYKNNTASTIPKGTIVIYDTSDINGASVKVSGLKNSTQIVGVANEDIAAGVYGEVVKSGLCSVLVSGAVTAGDTMTNNAGNAEKIATSTDREVLIAMEANTTGVVLKKAILVNRR